jgi:hypothetical protein
MVQGLGFYGLVRGFRVQVEDVSEITVYGEGCGVLGVGFSVQGFGIKGQCSGSSIHESGFAPSVPEIRYRSCLGEPLSS